MNAMNAISLPAKQTAHPFHIIEHKFQFKLKVKIKCGIRYNK